MVIKFEFVCFFDLASTKVIPSQLCIFKRAVFWQRIQPTVFQNMNFCVVSLSSRIIFIVFVVELFFYIICWLGMFSLHLKQLLYRQEIVVP